MRSVCCPRKIEFLKNPLNWIDFLAVLSYYYPLVYVVNYVAGNVEYDVYEGHSAKFQMLFFFRVLRILRYIYISEGILY